MQGQQTYNIKTQTTSFVVKPTHDLAVAIKSMVQLRSRPLLLIVILPMLGELTILLFVQLRSIGYKKLIV